MYLGATLEILILLALVTLGAIVLGGYMAKVFSGDIVISSWILTPLEKLLYRLFRIDEIQEMDWKVYLKNLILFNIIGIGFLFILQQVQGILPLNPEKMGRLSWDTALNVAISFVTNTNWQAYSGETTMSYLTQMLGLTVQNFLSAAVGMTVAVVFIRAFIRKETKNIGNFWVDLTRAIVYVLLPLSLLFSIILMSQGVIQNFKPSVTANTLEGEIQKIAQGPAASQIAIKHLGTNGGGFFNANSAHPYENPTALTNFLEMFGVLLIPAAIPFMFGSMIGRLKQAWVLYSVILALFILGLIVATWSELQGNPLLKNIGVIDGLNMEGKEARIGVLNSVFFSQCNTAACGAVNNTHGSLMPLTEMVLIFNIMIEVIFGGVGTGFVVILGYVMLTVFLVGLMVGHTSEIFGKKIESFEMKLLGCLLVLPSLTQWILGAIAISSTAGLSVIDEAGPHGLSQIIYTFASGAGNNGSAFGGNANTFFYNILMALAMLVGRFAVLIPAMVIAGSFAVKKEIPKLTRFSTETSLFAMLLFSVVIMGGLTFFPLLSIGPFLEHLLIQLGEFN